MVLSAGSGGVDWTFSIPDSDLDFLAPGRLVFGVGTGWMRDEFDSLAVPFEERANRRSKTIRKVQ